MYSVAGTLAINGIDAALAQGMADRVRGERRRTAGRPVALAAVVDEEERRRELTASG